ncbi:type IV secretion system protein VirB3 [Caulobacter sp. NIBR2454]|uniref:type IV secretion system protein VirB3 n=1 Tax=Caulobacter sp. NIBR2454 TaxID=3015996 RepID=UPI0022B5EA89|nr:type IV secretion system protein VirB3 [Caulobacter sp. NIBR2454]
MAGQPERLTRDTLFLACTRPALVLGVPMEAMGINLIVSAVAFLGGGSLLYLLAAPAVHLVLRAICRHDHHALRLWWLHLQTRGRSRNAALWGGSACSPLAFRKVRHG